MLKNPAGWLAIGVLAIATIVMVFFVMPRISDDKQPLGAAINEAGKQVEQAVAEGGKAAQDLVEGTKPKEPATTTPSAPMAPAQSAQAPAASSTAPTAAQAPASNAPTFDVLRVEPDGSTVIAGRAEPGTTLEVADKNSVLAKADVANGGEFAAILDNPLPPGDHELVLKVTGKDGKTVVSEEVATISVPAVKGGELLAMVTKPGEASRLMATPTTGEQAPSKTERVAVSAETKPADSVNKPANPEVAVTAPNAGSVTAKTDAAGQKAEIQITAVEIEGDRLFVAGIAKPQAKLRGYADDTKIGDASAAANGHFVIDGKVPLSVGDHRIAVEQLGADGKALVRVAVPFNRPAGDQVAAVASPSASSSGKILMPIDGGAFDNLRNQVARAHEILTRLYADGAVPTVEQLAAARSATMIALNSLTQYRLPADASAEARRIAEMTVAQATAALKALEALPRDTAEFGKGFGEISTIIASAVGPVVDTPPTSQAVAPAEVAAAGNARIIEQAPLTQSENASVIIRRGDTLWQISRRVYGQGVRYTTIYLANEDKITNPDLIQPGQVFGVPNEARPDAEEQHRKWLDHNKS
ncbi:LysM peptidoglycan-binding domain-containing protein [Rhizobiales bacterium RZME27]|uniref:LysM peptidoglycan-binding domain-containing protein n=1 Tax=Endobacterium cereale TaxID=2663029 RepID=A0A6A8A3A4_9HYPH|nr:Ig-like domain-containing protein [Endobacterium cereale]MEB2846208.1 Ig-like domain-containing protein [Endobacterium cereale]MQY45645.1 LysM peptidoglycan-binding domain-containing protein [Endobacterium cereale]